MKSECRWLDEQLASFGNAQYPVWNLMGRMRRGNASGNQLIKIEKSVRVIVLADVVATDDAAAAAVVVVVVGVVVVVMAEGKGPMSGR